MRIHVKDGGRHILVATTTDYNCQMNPSGLLIAQKKDKMRLEDPAAHSESVLAMVS